MMAVMRGSQVRSLLLAGSIALNLLLLGVVGAQWLRPPRAPFDMMMSHLTAELPGRDAEFLRTVLNNDRPRYAAAQAELHAAHRAIERAVAADAFDPAALRAALDEWRQRWSMFVALVGESVTTALQEISPEGRRRLAESFAHARGRE